jgi:hypothetical protein
MKNQTIFSLLVLPLTNDCCVDKYKVNELENIFPFSSAQAGKPLSLCSLYVQLLYTFIPLITPFLFHPSIIFSYIFIVQQFYTDESQFHSSLIPSKCICTKKNRKIGINCTTAGALTLTITQKWKK